MGWLLSLLKTVLGWFVPMGINYLVENLVSWWVARQERIGREAESKKKATELKSDLQKAGDDAKAQEDAADKFFSPSK